MTNLILALILMVNAQTNDARHGQCDPVVAQVEALEAQFDVDLFVYEDCSVELVS